MNSKFFLLLAVLLLAPWPIAYAHNYVKATPQDHAIQIEAAEPGIMPTWNTFGRAIGGVDTPGDLFYIDANENPADMLITLHLINTQELRRCYTYLILKIGVYIEGETDEWSLASLYDGMPIPDTFITDLNGRVSFILSGYAKYKVTIDSGCFYCVRAADGDGVSPQFYLTADPIIGQPLLNRQWDKDTPLETVSIEVTQAAMPTSVESAASSELDSDGPAELRTPTFQEVRDFILRDPTSRNEFVLHQYECRHFATEVNNNAEAAGLRCAFVLLCFDRGQHSVIAFETTDRGLVYIEPQTDAAIHPKVGGQYQGREIKEILIAW